jgi:hypothetical protein
MGSSDVKALEPAQEDNVVVTWWERNNTHDEPVARISNNAGETFGPLLILSQNDYWEWFRIVGNTQ